MTVSTRIYRRDANGTTRFWQYETAGPQWRTVIGQVGGKETTSGWTSCAGKNVGRSNETSPEQQACAEAGAEEIKKLAREYRRNVEALDGVPVSPMLAQSFDKQKVIRYPVYSQYKLDGSRALISRNGAFTREYQRHNNVDHIMAALGPVFEKYPDMMLDGELYNHDLKDNFNKIMSVVRRQFCTNAERAEAKALIQFHCYDHVSDKPFGERRLDLQALFQPDGHPVRLVPTLCASSRSQLDEFYSIYLEAGYEGQMVRLDGPYEADRRSKTLLKRKEFLTDEFKLLRVEEGNGNWSGYAKRAVFALADGREVGAGIKGDQTFTKKLLAEAQTWGQKKQVTVKYFTPTPDGIPRFPVATDWHPYGRQD